MFIVVLWFVLFLLLLLLLFQFHIRFVKMWCVCVYFSARARAMNGACKLVMINIKRRIWEENVSVDLLMFAHVVSCLVELCNCALMLICLHLFVMFAVKLQLRLALITRHSLLSSLILLLHLYLSYDVISSPWCSDVEDISRCCCCCGCCRLFRIRTNKTADELKHENSHTIA